MRCEAAVPGPPRNSACITCCSHEGAWPGSSSTPALLRQVTAAEAARHGGIAHPQPPAARPRDETELRAGLRRDAILGPFFGMRYVVYGHLVSKNHDQTRRGCGSDLGREKNVLEGAEAAVPCCVVL